MKREWLIVVFFEPLLDVETWAGSVGELVVAVDRGYRVFFHKIADELEEGEALERGAGVSRATVGIKAADISDADAVGVVAWAMGTDLFDGTASVDAAIGVDDIMIADVVPAEGTVVFPYGFHRTDGIGAGGGAVDDDFGDCSHGANGFSGFNGRLWAAMIFAPQGRGAHQQHTGQREASRLPAVRSACLVRD